MGGGFLGGGGFLIHAFFLGCARGAFGIAALLDGTISARGHETTLGGMVLQANMQRARGLECWERLRLLSSTSS